MKLILPKNGIENTLMDHLLKPSDTRITINFGVSGFFFLSAFLLTHHLLKELIEANYELKSIAKIICKYFIKRFFRIYMSYVIFVTIIKFGPQFSQSIMKSKQDI